MTPKKRAAARFKYHTDPQFAQQVEALVTRCVETEDNTVEALAAHELVLYGAAFVWVEGGRFHFIDHDHLKFRRPATRGGEVRAFLKWPSGEEKEIPGESLLELAAHGHRGSTEDDKVRLVQEALAELREFQADAQKR